MPSAAMPACGAHGFDPFEITDENGTQRDPVCEGLWGGSRNFLLEQWGFSRFELPYLRVLRTEGPDDYLGHGELWNYFIDASDRIIEIQKLHFTKASELVSFSIASTDAAGGLSFLFSDSLPAGNHLRTAYVPADGSAAGGFFREKLGEYQMLRLERADHCDTPPHSHRARPDLFRVRRELLQLRRQACIEERADVEVSRLRRSLRAGRSSS
ncbi:MAG: hypothetical protein NDJ89_10160 [Oligoflexia bacterium]|nr:hypothetical protein [Oligoflexia bacterium]